MRLAASDGRCVQSAFAIGPGLTPIRDEFALLRRYGNPTLKAMPPLRSRKLAQLGGIGALAAYLLLQALWLTTVAIDDTGDDALLLVVIGAPCAFALGWFAVPALASRLTPQAKRGRRSGRFRRSLRVKSGGAE